MDQNIEKINYITDYLANYNQYISSLNKLGLTDAAVLFEMFATKICNLWFGQPFQNLNVAKSNYPYVDLISKDGTLFVQVSTVQYIPTKIKSTLENIEKAVIKDPMSNVARITSIKFFVAGNDSVRNVRDYTGSNKIGNVEFQKSQDLITFQSIIERCKNEEIFLRELYTVLHDETVSYKKVTQSITDAVERSKNLIDRTIVGLIGEQYEIDRNEILRKIESEERKFISIEGQAGSGKSVLCKMLLKEKEVVLFARAEKFAQVASLNDVWNIDVKDALKFLNGREVFFYIDALEYISDCSRTTQDLLVELYSLVQKYKNARIVTSCRTSEKAAFNWITASFDVTYYIVPELTDDQILEIAKAFPTIGKYVKNTSYKELLRIPFNIELIVGHIGEDNSFADINSFRTFVWNSVICLDRKISGRNFTKKEVRDTVNDIVFTRAIHFSVGVPEDDYNSEIIEFLLSNNILISNDGCVRLKYDIYEDICFEQRIDGIFRNVRGNYTRFFSELEKLGRCVHRRYQIWIENKLISQSECQNFLYRIIEDANIPTEWSVQTLTGIIKSDHSSAFFDDFKDLIITNHLEAFLNVTNSRSFKTSLIKLKNGNAFTQLIPCGKGRSALIRITFNAGLYKNDNLRASIIKLCSDYANTNEKEEGAASDACRILEYYAEGLIQTEESRYTYGAWEKLNSLLNSIYQLAEYSSSWINNLWEKAIRSDCEGKRGLYHQIIESVIKSHSERMLMELTHFLPKELLSLEDAYWIQNSEKDKRNYYSERYGKEYLYGLNDRTTHYKFEFNCVEDNHLFLTLAIYSFWNYFNWTITFTNNAAQKYKENAADGVTSVIVVDGEGTKHEFIGCQEFWNVGVDEQAVPELISDAIYDLIRAATIWINTCKNNTKSFTDSIKSRILNESNNIMMLTVIEELGFLFRTELPGYAVELASSMDLIHFDIVKYTTTHTTASQRMLEKYILLSVSIPEDAIKKRYDRGKANDYTLQFYMMTVQLIDNVRKKAEAVLDYLYSIIPDSEQTANDYLQIQKMDLRLARKEEITDFIYRYVPQLTGNAKTLSEEADKRKSIDGTDEIAAIFSNITPKIENKTLTLEETIAIIDKLTAMMKEIRLTHVIEDYLVLFWSYVLNTDELAKDKRAEFCKGWIAGIESLFSNRSFHFNVNLSVILFRQFQRALDSETSNVLKRLCYNLLRYDDNNGIIIQIRNVLVLYLTSENKNVSQLLFNTCIALLSQETTAEAEIIEKYLYREEKLEIGLDGLKDFDFGIAADFIDCGLKLNDPAFKQFVQILVLKARNQGDDNCSYNNYHALYQIENYFSNKIIKGEEIDEVLEVLFADLESIKTSKNLFDFYEGCFDNILAAYFDAKKDQVLRARYESLISKLEQHIDLISDENTRNELYRYMFLNIGRNYIKDWNELEANYSISDKYFLITLWSKYGKYHPRGLLAVIYQMHIRELLPEVLLPLRNTLEALRTESGNRLDILVEDDSSSFALNQIISDTYFYYYDQVRNNEEFSNAFISILSILERTSFSGAGVIMDEFLGH